jgi:hypothetical protein
MERVAKVISKKIFLDGWGATKGNKEKIHKVVSEWECGEVLVVSDEIDTIKVYNPYDLNQNLGVCFAESISFH